MTTWVALNVGSAVIVSLIVAWKLGFFPEQSNRAEAIGMAMTASGMLLRVGPIVGKNLLNEQSPFDDWSVLLLHLGLAVYFLGRLYRDHRHWLNNELQKREARKHQRH